MENLKLTLHPNLDKQSLFANGSYGYLEDINGSVVADMRCSNTTEMAPSIDDAAKYSKLFMKAPKMFEALKSMFYCSYGMDTQNRKVFRMELDDWDKIKSLIKELK